MLLQISEASRQRMKNGLNAFSLNSVISAAVLPPVTLKHSIKASVTKRIYEVEQLHVSSKAI